MPKIKLNLDKKSPKPTGEKTKGQPFDFSYIKILLKKSSDKDSNEVLLERDWVTKN